MNNDNLALAIELIELLNIDIAELRSKHDDNSYAQNSDRELEITNKLKGYKILNDKFRLSTTNEESCVITDDIIYNFGDCFVDEYD